MGPRIRLLCVGRIKEKFFRDAVSEYSKRLSRYCSLEITELADEKIPEGASRAQEEQILKREGDRLLAAIRERDYVVALAIDGRMMDSVQLAEHLDHLSLGGQSSITLVIGASLGLSEELLARADERLSFSPLTFPHQLMRVIVLEQIYRAFRISRGEPYHK